MPWDPEIREQFDRVDCATPDLGRYNDGYTVLLNHLFPFDEGYRVYLEREGAASPAGTTDQAIVFLVKVEEHPVFFFDISSQLNIRDVGSRAIADREMRGRFARLVGDLKIPRLYGLSAVGPRFAVYEYTVATGVLDPELEAIAKHSRLDIGDDVAPAARWEYDLFEPRGEGKMREIVREVKEMCWAVREKELAVTARLRGVCRVLGTGTGEKS